MQKNLMNTYFYHNIHEIIYNFLWNYQINNLLELVSLKYNSDYYLHDYSFL